ncbi:TetR/AcrR family transcriptional regulator [Actinophytocola xanthii]|uniref:TetR family transcriptional regulator n=1 Tax=Actinophytocola xanthii TaxID=1912961 RepID=A0A1Q8CC84_9PSEU|nr:TetR/AcrR family transcriptional regulator [Actinophytocola xanthii]OLF11900.1 TetR family transcriptional regulator [Actinophytocola xanthii]
MVLFAGQGDARRALELLWRTPVTREKRPGPKPALTIDEIVDAAVAIADEEGMPALSMRAVGQRLGRSGMSLYTYVPNKSELVDLMYDHVHGELNGDYGLDQGWRPAVRAWAGDLWSFYQRHPWLLQVSQVRPVLGPNEYAVVETVARILTETSLPARTLLRVVGTLFHFVRGAAQTVAESRQAAAATGLSNEDWWAVRSAVVPEVVPDFARRYPTIVALGQADTFRPEEGVPYLESQAAETFRVGLATILDGVEAAMARGPGEP